MFILLYLATCFIVDTYKIIDGSLAATRKLLDLHYRTYEYVKRIFKCKSYTNMFLHFISIFYMK